MEKKWYSRTDISIQKGHINNRKMLVFSEIKSIFAGKFKQSMTLKEAIEARHSVRAYKEQHLTAALLAPTAVNQQKFSFEYVGMTSNRHQVRAKKGFSMIGYTKMDLGIAKYHFEIGAGEVNFDWV